MKKILIGVLLVLIFNPIVAQENPTEGIYLFSENGKCGLKYKEQVVLLPKYEDLTHSVVRCIQTDVLDIYNSSGDMIGYKQNQYWGIMSFDKIFVEPKYEKVEFLEIKHNGRLWSKYQLVKVKLNDKYGLATLGGQEILPLKYDEILCGFTLWNPEIKEDILCFVTKRNGIFAITTLCDEELYITFSMDDFKNKGKFKKLRKTILNEISKLYSVNKDDFSNRADKWIKLCRTGQPVKTKKQIKKVILGDSAYICDTIIANDWAAAYKVNGKYGLYDRRRIITSPIYDKAIPGGYWHIICKNGKFGLVSSDGKETIAPMNDQIIDVDDIIYVPWIWCIYATINNDTVNVVSPNNTILLSNIKWDKKKTIFENLKKNKKKIENAFEIWARSLEGKRVWDQYKSVLDLMRNSTSDFPFLVIEDDRGFEKISINGFEGKMYETGYIDIPFRYDRTDQILVRDPDNVFALKEKIDETIRHDSYSHVDQYNYSVVCEELEKIKQKKKAYELLVDLCEKKSYHGSDLLNNIKARIQWMDGKISDYEIGLAETMEVIEFTQKVDNIANVGTSIIGTITTALSNLENESGSDSGLSNESSGNGNYQEMYDKWARRAEKHYNSITKLGSSKESKSEASGSSGGKMSGGNFVAQKKSFREAQKEMKQIREKARRAGVIIKQSKWETATIDY